jgi:hypothetical protein
MALATASFQVHSLHQPTDQITLFYLSFLGESCKHGALGTRLTEFFFGEVHGLTIFSFCCCLVEARHYMKELPFSRDLLTFS